MIERCIVIGLLGMGAGCHGGRSTPAPKASEVTAAGKVDGAGARVTGKASVVGTAGAKGKTEVEGSKPPPGTDAADPATSGSAAGPEGATSGPAEVESTKGPAALAELVADLGLLDSSTIRCSTAQVSAEAPWADTEDLSGCSLKEGDELHVIAPYGVRVRTVDKPGRHDTPLVSDPTAGAFDVGLATKDHAPSADARLVERWLAKPGRDAKAIARWVKKRRKGRTFIPVGEVEGTFGGGIDRILVLRPKPLRRSWKEEAEDPDLTGEAALLVAGAEPRGFLPFDDVLSYDDFDGLGGDEDEEIWTEGVLGLQVAGVVDLDGDGIEEILWADQPSVPHLVTLAHLSYFVGGEHRLQTIWSCSYCGCEVFLPEPRCRGTVKFPKKGRKGKKRR